MFLQWSPIVLSLKGRLTVPVTHSVGKSNVNSKMFANIQGEKILNQDLVCVDDSLNCMVFGPFCHAITKWNWILEADPEHLGQCLPAKKAPCQSTAVSSSAGLFQFWTLGAIEPQRQE